MKSPYQRTIVFDTETGGLRSSFNSLTELAFVSVDMETLQEIDELEVMMLPYLDLGSMEEESLKEAKAIYKYLSTKDEDTGKKVLNYKGEKLGIKQLLPLSEEISNFRKFYLSDKTIIDYDELLEIETTQYKDLITFIV